jgi:uncharacterized protein YbjT (DUF2867 family)
MRIAITGGTGFVGRHLARRLASEGHDVVLIARGIDNRDTAVRAQPGIIHCSVNVADAEALAAAIDGCDSIAHCAGINREIGAQTYDRVHVQGTAAVVEAARRTGTRKIALLSFLRARPACGSPYHESKWRAEELVRQSGVDFTVLKAGMIFGRGDHMIDHLSHTAYTLPLFATVGWTEPPIRPVAVQDVVDVLRAALVDGRLTRQTVAVVGPETLRLSDAVRRVASVVGRRVLVVRSPQWIHYPLSLLFESTMKIPLVAKAQVRILSEGVTEALPFADGLPADLTPQTPLNADTIREALPAPGPFTPKDLRWCS